MLRKLSFAVVVLICTVTGAVAVDFTAPLTDLAGKQFTDPSGKELSVTLGKICTDALLASYPDEQSLAGEEKIKRFRLAIKITGGTEKTNDGGKNVSVSAAEIELIKKLVAKSYNSLITGKVWLALDPASVN